MALIALGVTGGIGAGNRAGVVLEAGGLSEADMLRAGRSLYSSNDFITNNRHPRLIGHSDPNGVVGLRTGFGRIPSYNATAANAGRPIGGVLGRGRVGLGVVRMSRSSGVPRQVGMNEIVITGSTGVIGRRAVREILTAGYRVTGVTR